MQVPSLDREDPLEEGMAIVPVFLPGKPCGQKNLAATVHKVSKSWTRLRDSHKLPGSGSQNLKDMIIN